MLHREPSSEKVFLFFGVAARRFGLVQVPQARGVIYDAREGRKGRSFGPFSPQEGKAAFAGQQERFIKEASSGITRSFVMSQHQSSLSVFGTPVERIEAALESLRRGNGVLVVDDENRENEGDLIFSAQNITDAQMAALIRECSGIVCLCLPEERVRLLDLPMMAPKNTNKQGTAFTVSIEAASGVTTGVSAGDRVRTVKAAIADNAVPEDLCRPGHVFPLQARSGGVLERPGHTEATVDLMRLAGLKPFGVLCELTNPDGTMARLPEVIEFGRKNNMPVISVEDLSLFRKEQCAGGYERAD